MSVRYLLDTNVLSEPLRPQPDEHVLHMLEQHEGALATATLVWHELWFGCLRLPPSKRRHVIERYLMEVVGPYIPLLPYDERAARWHAEERARLSQMGRTPPFVDGQIAAIAAVNGLILVTRNVNDYSDFHELHVETWHVT